MSRVLACGSGSIGHLAPLVAVCRALCAASPQTTLLIACGTRPKESGYLREENLPYITLPVPQRSWAFLQTFFRSYRAASHLLQAFQPDIILSRGGAVSLPLCLAAARRRLPIILHESDRVMGLATRGTAWWARSITTGFPKENYPHIFRSSLTATGNPLRPEITKGSREEGLRITKLSGKRPILLVIGGSQGAQAINEIVMKLLPTLTHWCDVVHIAGPGKLKPNTYNLKPTYGYWSTEFAHDELPHLYAIATIALSRAGATFLSELAANGIPSIMVPLRGLAQDHQWYNAKFFADHHACVLLEQECLTEQLIPTIQNILDHHSMYEQMRKNLLTLHHPDAARHIAEIVLKNIA